MDGRCVCKGNWEGASCSDCNPNFTGDNCDVPVVPVVAGNNVYLITGGIILLVLLALSAVGFLVWRYIKRRRARSNRQRVVFDLGEEDEDFLVDNNTATELRSINTEQISRAIEANEDPQTEDTNNDGDLYSQDKN